MTGYQGLRYIQLLILHRHVNRDMRATRIKNISQAFQTVLDLTKIMNIQKMLFLKH